MTGAWTFFVEWLAILCLAVYNDSDTILTRTQICNYLGPSSGVLKIYKRGSNDKGGGKLR